MGSQTSLASEELAEDLVEAGGRGTSWPEVPVEAEEIHRDVFCGSSGQKTQNDTYLAF